MSRIELKMEHERPSIKKGQLGNQHMSNQFAWFLAITGTVFAGSGLYLVVWLLLNLA